MECSVAIGRERSAGKFVLELDYKEFPRAIPEVHYAQCIEHFYTRLSEGFIASSQLIKFALAEERVFVPPECSSIQFHWLVWFLVFNCPPHGTDHGAGCLREARSLNYPMQLRCASFLLKPFRALLAK